MNTAAILGDNIGETYYITSCSKKIKLNPQEYFRHVHQCQICQENSPFISQLKNLHDIEGYQYYDLLGLKSMSEIIIDEISQNKNQEFYCDEYEEFLINTAPFRCTDCNSDEVLYNQKSIKEHLKTCKDSQENSLFQQALQEIDLSQYWDIHKKAFILDVLYIINWVTLHIIKKLLKQCERKNHQNLQSRGYKCGECQQFKDNLIKHDACNYIACTNCYEKHIRQQVEQNHFQIQCQKCENKLTIQLIQKILNHSISLN